jgi:hypothetical protein
MARKIKENSMGLQKYNQTERHAGTIEMKYGYHPTNPKLIIKAN